ncbi:MAG: YeeE/YedE family protein [Pseudomonadales bacterium]|nr:YeeE/YedE family protein [Pseudomonadales bacterium]
MTNVIAALCGLLFGAGLMLSEMVNPARVQGFLDLFNGVWDPTLAFVMGGALLVTLPGFALARRRTQPLCADCFAEPAATVIDRPLLLGAALFGLGWGLAGLCPGPALVNLISFEPQALLFVAAMLGGMYCFKVRRG